MDSVQIINGTFMAELPDSIVGNTNIFLTMVSDYIDPDMINAFLAEIVNWLNLAQIAGNLNLEFYQPHIAFLLGSLLSGLSDILLVVGSIAWAIFQH
ncbi:hypothetical protein MKX08_004501 [Trichoderma sp. CBMAI-0020]|nr:hypothetical protein MKX08_004501 [Trichoderma sp. CBMAI-0020]